MSCATCHRPEYSWTDGRALGIGDRNQTLSRRVPTLLNLAWGESFFWDGRASALEEQALGPIQNPEEMNLPLTEMVNRLNTRSDYQILFHSAFPHEPINAKNSAKAIAVFERTIVSGLSRFDLWIAGNENALNASEKNGFVLFNEKGRCVQCHTGWNFTNGSFADVGMITTDRGRGILLKDEDSDFAFKTPTLRNISERQFYFHDGHGTDLLTIIENYNRGGEQTRPTSKLFLRPLGLSTVEKNELLSFLQSLSSNAKAVLLTASKPQSAGAGEKQWDTISASP